MSAALVKISETPTTRSKGAGNRPGWFTYPGHQYVHLDNGQTLQVPAGRTPLDFCATQGIDTTYFLATLAQREREFQASHKR